MLYIGRRVEIALKSARNSIIVPGVPSNFSGAPCEGFVGMSRIDLVDVRVEEEGKGEIVDVDAVGTVTIGVPVGAELKVAIFRGYTML